MRYRFEVEFSADSATIRLHDLDEMAEYSLLIGPRRSAQFFVNLILDGVQGRGDSAASVSGSFERRNLGIAICHIASSKDYNLVKCDTSASGES